MTPERWQQIRAVFEQAEEASGEDRMRLLDRLCADHPGLRRQVEHLLSGDDSARNLIHDAIAEQAALLGEQPLERV